MAFSYHQVMPFEQLNDLVLGLPHIQLWDIGWQHPYKRSRRLGSSSPPHVVYLGRFNDFKSVEPQTGFQLLPCRRVLFC